MSRSAHSKLLNHVMEQGYSRWEAKKMIAVQEMVPLDRGQATTSTSSGSITQRALREVGLCREKRRRQPAGRHRLDEHDGVGWFNALVALAEARGHEVWRFDVLLAKARQKEAYDAKELGTATWLQRRARRELQKRLGYVPEMVFAVGIESAGGWNLHVHVVMVIDPNMKRRVEAALRAFAKRWTARRGAERQIVSKRVRTAGDVIYVVENAIATQNVGFVPGRTLVVTQSIKSAATNTALAERKPSERQDATPSNAPEAKIPADATTCSINIDLAALHSLRRCENTIDIKETLIHQADTKTEDESNSRACRAIHPQSPLRSTAERPRGRGDEELPGPSRAGRPGRAKDRPRYLRRRLAQRHPGATVVSMAGFQELIERERGRRAFERLVADNEKREAQARREDERKALEALRVQAARLLYEADVADWLRSRPDRSLLPDALDKWQRHLHFDPLAWATSEQARYVADHRTHDRPAALVRALERFGARRSDPDAALPANMDRETLFGLGLVARRLWHDSGWHQHREVLAWCLRVFSNSGCRLMTAREHRELDAMPDPLPLWRGFTSWVKGPTSRAAEIELDIIARGSSWTPRRDVAERFAVPGRQPFPFAFIANVTAPKALAAAYFANEAEIIFAEPERLPTITIEPAPCAGAANAVAT